MSEIKRNKQRSLRRRNRAEMTRVMVNWKLSEERVSGRREWIVSWHHTMSLVKAHFRSQIYCFLLRIQGKYRSKPPAWFHPRLNESLEYFLLMWQSIFWKWERIITLSGLVDVQGIIIFPCFVFVLLLLFCFVFKIKGSFCRNDRDCFSSQLMN